MKIGKPYKPASYKSPTDWYIAPYSRSLAVHVFPNLSSARKWARSQPSDIVGGVDMVASLDWLPKHTINLSEAIARGRTYVDHR